MKVKITKCSNVDYWYNDKIGEVFEVLTEENYYVAGHISSGLFIAKDDCEIIPDIAVNKIKAEDYLKVIRLSDGQNTIYLDKNNNGKSFCIRPKEASSFKFQGGYNSLKTWRNIAELILKAVEVCEKGE